MNSTSMNLFQRVSLSGAFLVFTAIVVGLGFSIHSIHEATDKTAGVNDPISYIKLNYPTLLVAVILVVTRLKFLLDNHTYFAEPQQDKLLPRLIGFLLAMICWIFYAVAATTILKPIISLEIMGLGIMVSCFWLLVHVWEVRLIRESKGEIGMSKPLDEDLWPHYQINWFIFNFVYLFIIWLYTGFYVGIFPCVREAPWLLLLFLLVVAIDYAVSKTYFNVLSKKETAQNEL
jgi:hypothetical protein